MSEKVVILGAGGHGKVLADIICASHDEVVGFLDDKIEKGSRVLGFPVLGPISDAQNMTDVSFIIGVGNSAARERIAGFLPGVKWYTAIHPSAVISPFDTFIAEGAAVMANAVINPGSTIGRHCIINTAAVVEHECHISDYCHISVGATLAGNVNIGPSTWVGIGAVVINNADIVGGCYIGAGAVVVKNLTEKGTYVGVPARKIA